MTTSDQQLRQEKVGRYLALGLKPVQIAARLGVTDATIQNDVRTIRSAWRASPLALIRADEWMGRQIAIHEQVIIEAFDAWNRSKEPVETVTSEQRGKRRGENDEVSATKAGMKRVTQTGDPQFLRVMQQSSAEIAKLLGLYAYRPRTLNFNVSSLTDEQLTRLIAGEDPAQVVNGTYAPIDADSDPGVFGDA